MMDTLRCSSSSSELGHRSYSAVVDLGFSGSQPTPCGPQKRFLYII